MSSFGDVNEHATVKDVVAGNGLLTGVAGRVSDCVGRMNQDVSLETELWLTTTLCRTFRIRLEEIRC